MKKYLRELSIVMFIFYPLIAFTNGNYLENYNQLFFIVPFLIFSIIYYFFRDQKKAHLFGVLFLVIHIFLMRWDLYLKLREPIIIYSLAILVVIIDILIVVKYGKKEKKSYNKPYFYIYSFTIITPIIIFLTLSLFKIDLNFKLKMVISVITAILLSILVEKIYPNSDKKISAETV